MVKLVHVCVISVNNVACLTQEKKKQRKKGMEIVFETPPAKYKAMLVLCFNNFNHSAFSNFSA